MSNRKTETIARTNSYFNGETVSGAVQFLLQKYSESKDNTYLEISKLILQLEAKINNSSSFSFSYPQPSFNITETKEIPWCEVNCSSNNCCSNSHEGKIKDRYSDNPYLGD